MSSIVRYEPRVNDAVQAFMNRTEQVYVSTSKVCDFKIGFYSSHSTSLPRSDIVGKSAS